MSELIFVRHGQASFGASSYDKLSEQGIEQVRTLARHWSAMGESFDHIVSGGLLRQRETAQELLPLVVGAGRSIEIIPAFNEYNGDPLIRIYLRDYAAELAALDETAGELSGDILSNIKSEVAGDASGEIPWLIKNPRLFQKILELATARWIVDELEPIESDTGFERFHEFRSRVHSAVDELMAEHGRGKRVLVATSGGVIAMMLQAVLHFPDAEVIATNWMVQNSSVTRIRYGAGRVSMAQFNAMPHLEQKGMQHLITYR